MDDAKKFIRQHAAEIAQALRDQEESPKERQEESTASLYRALCFDEPLIDDIPNLAATASALARQLTIPSSPFALSNRLVNGIVYLCRQRSNQTKESPSSSLPSLPSSPTSTTNNSSVTALALAKLAFSVLVQVPLFCCQHLHTNNFTSLQRYLGSYKGLIYENTQHHSVDLDKTDRMVNQLAENMARVGTTEEPITGSPQGENDPTHLNETSSLQEVWATESDPSDYDFGEGDATTDVCHLPQTAIVLDLLDPTVLSQADPNLTLDDAKASIASLLQQANYSLFEPLFQLPKKQVETYISELTQLLLLLLQPPQSILLSSEDTSSSYMQDAILTPLWILRDIALHHPSTEHSFYAVSYLEVLQTLLAMDQAYLSDTKQQMESPLCSASIVGLSALSSWCCSAQISVPVTITAILDSMNDLAHVMERASASGYRENLKHTVTPILDLLTGITYQERKVGAPPSTGTMLIPQTLLNTGLLRQLLILSLDDQATSSLPPYSLDHTIWGLCVVYPTVVGKYVVRYPGFSSIVRRYHPPVADSISARDCVHSILWNSFTVLHCSDGSQQPQIVWKNKEANGTPQLTPLTTDECKEVCEKSWVRLCGIIQASVEGSLLPQQAVDSVLEWERLFKMVGHPTVAPTFQSVLPEHDLQLALIRTSLMNCAPDTEANFPNDNEDDDKNGDDDNDDEKKKSSMTQHQLMVATTRKLLKQYTLFFQGNARSSSKTD